MRSADRSSVTESSPPSEPRLRHGILVVDKPRGITSHDAVMRIRRALSVRQVGHAGTLDPMATGVLVVAVGEGTKLVPYLTAETKVYEATIALGSTTDTLDAFGKVTEQVPLSRDVLEDLRGTTGDEVRGKVLAALETERARTMQIPPAISAIHDRGERAHIRARRGEEVELAPRPVHVQTLSILDAADDPPNVVVRLQVSKGFYVRSLARDFAKALATVGHLTALRRSRSGTFTIGEALPLDTPGDELSARMIGVSHAASRVLPTLTLTAEGVSHARAGRVVPAHDLGSATAGFSAWLTEKGEIVAIGKVDESGAGRVLRGFGTTTE